MDCLYLCFPYHLLPFASCNLLPFFLLIFSFLFHFSCIFSFRIYALLIFLIKFYTVLVSHVYHVQVKVVYNVVDTH